MWWRRSVQESLAGRRDLSGAVDEHEVTAAQQQVTDGDAQAPGHVVVAHPRLPQRRLDAMVRQPVIPWNGRHRHQALDGLRDLRRAQAVVMAAALLLHRQQMAGEQAREMAARRRRRHAGEIGQLLRG